jgi:hypothetical protein
MQSIIEHARSESAHNNSAGRPAYRTDPDGVRALRRLLSQGPYLLARSSVTGRRPTLRAMSYMLWARDAYTPWSFGRRTPPPLAAPDELDRVRRDAVRVVRQTLLDRARAAGDAAEVARLRVADDPLRSPRAQPSLDESAIAEEVASRYLRNGPNSTEARRAERHMERLLAEAAAWEYRHPGREDFTGRRALPEPRS